MAETPEAVTDRRDDLDDDGFRGWMNTNLATVAGEFDLVLTGTPVYGWRLRSISSAARTRTGDRRWLRVGGRVRPGCARGAAGTSDTKNRAADGADRTTSGSRSPDHHAARRHPSHPSHGPVPTLQRPVTGVPAPDQHEHAV